MWWIEFERRLNLAFQTYVKREGRVVHSDEMKLHTVLDKVKCQWINPIKATIAVRLSESPVMITYDKTLRAFKSEVNKKFPPTLSITTPTRRHIHELSGGSGGRTQFGQGGRSHGCGSRRSYQGGRGRGKGGGRMYKTHPDRKFIMVQNFQQVVYHASFNFPGHVFRQMKQQDIDMLKK